MLVVDDNKRMRQMLARVLEAAGFDVVEAGTQRQARARLAHTRPDALVLNLQRSETDGLEVLHWIRARQGLHTTPIIFLAGCDSNEFRWQALRAGADWFGLRPLGMRELHKRVGDLIRHGRPRLKIIAACAHPLCVRRLKPTG
ncbi:MAG: response regulator [Chloroflexi bacterium]|nr:response regulator [Chloroflexota bacterium]